MFIIAIINLFFKNEVLDSVANIGFADTMLKGGLVKFNDIFKHKLVYIEPFLTARGNSGVAGTEFREQ
ncbi:hypothetical protein FACS1894200_11270 [Spirochaetia bacterium]|nr:hypothetical protein FACS1894200_11270 [Spirochaetia bacterium]